MTGTAVFGFYIIGIANIKRTVWLMTAQAIFIGKEIGMWLMAFYTFFDLLMFRGVTKGAVLCGMLTGEGFELFTLFWMAGFAGDADRRYIVDSNIQGSMWVAVTAQAIRKFEMILNAWCVAH